MSVLYFAASRDATGTSRETVELGGSGGGGAGAGAGAGAGGEAGAPAPPPTTDPLQ